MCGRNRAPPPSLDVRSPCCDSESEPYGTFFYSHILYTPDGYGVTVIGHSMGARPGFEVIRALRALGEGAR